MVKSDAAQPNGALFELLTAGAYLRAGGKVSFRKERSGVSRSHDLDVELHGITWAVECKRIEGTDYSEIERAEVRILSQQPFDVLLNFDDQKSFIFNVDFNIPIIEVQQDYLVNKVAMLMNSGNGSYLWYDETSTGVLGEIDMSAVNPLIQNELTQTNSASLIKTMLGSYRRNDNRISVLKLQFHESPLFVKEIERAVVMRWQCHAEESIDQKAKDVLKYVVDARDQLPPDYPSVIHIAFEALAGDAVEERRYQKIQTGIRLLGSNHIPVACVYTHFFVPEAPPDEPWAFDETVAWFAVDPRVRPLRNAFVVLPDDVGSRSGTHWQ